MKNWPILLYLGAAAAADGPAVAARQPAAAPAAPASFDPTTLVPYFEAGPAAEAARRLRAMDHRAAAKLFADYLAEHPKAPDAVQARFLLGLSELRDRGREGEGEEARRALGLKAARTFDQLAGKYPLLDAYVALYAARGYLQGERPALALLRIERIGRPGGAPADPPLVCDARLVRAEAQQRLGQRERALGEYTAYLGECEGGRRYEVKARLGQLCGELGQKEAAIGYWRSLYLEAPTESYGAMAERALREAGAAETYTPQELLGRAQVLFDNMRNPESEAAYQRVLGMKEASPAERCVAQFQMAQSVFKQRQRPRAAPLFDEAIKVCAPPMVQNEELHMKAMYQAARCHGSKGELQAAADLFAAAEAAHPGHSYADDARLRQAEMYADLQEKLEKLGPKEACQQKACPDYEARVTSLLAALPELYPAGDQRSEALWRLAFRAYRKKDYAGARRALLESLRRVPRESGWAEEGRTLYWLGRLSELTGDDAGAASSYRRAATEYPLSYYTLMAMNRLRERMPRELDALLAELTKEPAPGTGTGPGPGPGIDQMGWRFAPRPLFSQPGFQRAVELLRLGMGPEARQELGGVGIRAPEGKGVKVASADEEELLWLTAILYDRAGEWRLSHWLPRHTLTAYQRRYPVGAARREWLLSYPRGYEDLLVEAARKNGQPEALQIAIVREESAFDPYNESFANAIGLTQMIPPTAKRFSEGLPTTREALRDPAVNVAIGSRFLGFLWSTMQGNPALAIAGYNAGENAVFRWLQARGDLDLDAWIEAIPFDETRGYTKRVLSSYLTYSWLAPGSAPIAARIPQLSLRLPALPQVKKVASREEDPHRK